MRKDKRYIDADFYLIDAGERVVPLFTIIPPHAKLSKDEETILTILRAREGGGAKVKKVKAKIVY